MIMRSIALLVAIAAGLAASQIPEFGQQYRQRLGGAVDELNRVIEAFDRDAATAGTDRSGGLMRMAQNAEPLVRAQAITVAEIILRHARLTEQQRAFESAPPFVRMTTFVRDFDRPLVERTLRDFEPAVPATVEGIAFAATGFLAIYLILGGLGALFRPRRRHRFAESG